MFQSTLKKHSKIKKYNYNLTKENEKNVIEAYQK